MPEIRQPVAQPNPADRQSGTIEVLFQMITTKIDRRRQNDRAAAGRFRETGEKIVSGDNSRAMLHRAQEFLEIFTAQWPAMFLFAKHDRVVEIKNNTAICALQQPELEFIETDCLEKDDYVMPTRLLENAQPLGHARTTSRNDRRFHAQSGIVIQTITQP